MAQALPARPNLDWLRKTAKDHLRELRAAGFTAARFITHDAFEGRPTSLTVLNIAHELVTLVVMAIIIGVWPPAGTV